MVEDIMEAEGLDAFKAAVTSAIAFKHKKLFPEYVLNRTSGTQLTGTMRPTAEEIARKQVELKEERKIAEIRNKDAKKALICTETLYGHVEGEEDGKKYCVYPFFTDEETKWQKVPLHMTHASYAENQWMPSKEIVLKRRPEILKEFNIRKGKE